MRFTIAATALASALGAVPAQAAPIFLQFTANAIGTRFDYIACPPGPGPTPPPSTCEVASPIAPSFSFAQNFTFTNGVSNYLFGYPTTGTGEISFMLRDLGANLFRIENFSYSKTSSLSGSGYVPGGFRESASAAAFVVSSVPEPATWTMLIFGFGAMGAAMRQRRQARVTFA